MSDFKINSGSGINLPQFNQEQKLDQQINRSGNFQGQNVNAAQPPAESPVIDGAIKKAFNAASVQPPTESPLSSKPAKGYRISETSNSATSRNAPSNEALFDFATGKNTNASISKYLEQDPAASKAVATIRQANKEIGSPDNNPKLDTATQTVLAQLASKIFQR
jgi:hypothetical protein